MPCDLVIKVQELVLSYQGLIESCCDPTGPATVLFPSNVTTMCGDGGGLIQEIWLGVNGLLDGDVQSDCATFTADPAEPDPGEPAGQGCLNATYLGDLLDWIDGISCNQYCSSCYQTPMEQQYRIDIDGLLNVLAQFNGTYTVSHAYDCWWEYTIAPGSLIRLRWDKAFQFHVRLQWDYQTDRPKGMLWVFDQECDILGSYPTRSLDANDDPTIQPADFFSSTCVVLNT